MIVPDSDVWTRPDLLQPVFALGKELEGRGAKVAVLKLPAGPDGAKVGLDDYLCAHAREAFDALPRLGAQARGLQPDERLVARLGEAQGGGRRRPEPRPTALELLERAETVRVLHPAQDVVDGVLWYGVPVDGALVVDHLRRARRTAPTGCPRGSRSATPTRGRRR